MKRALCIASVLLGCAAPSSELGSAQEAIANGTREMGRPEVVFMYRLDGAACTGSIISPYVVLTANHCVATNPDVGTVAAPANYFRIYVGSSTRQLTAEYTVREVRQAPGAGTVDNGNDVALLILSQPTDVAPITLARTTPWDLVGHPITAVGFGQTQTGSAGTKYTIQTNATMYFEPEGFMFVDPSVCEGDSGGPLIGPNGQVYGVASFITSADGRTQPVCGTAPGAYTVLERHLPFIDSVLTETGTCVPSGPETCNGRDDDCNMQVDETCTPIGQACTDSSQCVGALCAETDAGRLCTSMCDPLRPDQGCGPGFYCSSSGLSCDGFCVPGAAGTGGNGAECQSDSDCHSYVCVDPGNGTKRCLEPCEGDLGLCLAGEVCAAGGGSCGACIGQEIFGSPHGLGEPCEVDTDCRSGMCHERAGVKECVTSCSDAAPCAAGFECREAICVRDQRQGVGGVCVDNADCPGAACAAQGSRHWCTTVCTDASGCPTGFDCVSAGGTMVCAPHGNLDGEDCQANEDCATSLCATMNGRSLCTRECDAHHSCAPGFLCQRAADGITAVCVTPTRPPTSRGGCAIGTRQNGSALALVLAGAALLGAVRRRRRR